MSLFNCEINLTLTCYANCAFCETNSETTFAVTDRKLCIPVVISSTQDNVTLLKQLKSGFKQTIN